MAKNINSFNDAVAALGGVKAVARLTGRGMPNVCQWRSRNGAFPASLYPVIKAALAERGYEVPIDIFTFELPTKRPGTGAYDETKRAKRV